MEQLKIDGAEFLEKYNNQSKINVIDEKLLILRETWADAEVTKKEKWMAQINTLLEERFELTNPVDV